MRLLPVLAAVVLAIAGCNAPRDTASAPVISVPPLLVGTWMIADGASGFLAIGQRQVVCNLPGMPRQVTLVSGCDVEPGLGAGRLVLADGTQLFVARGTSMRGPIPVDHLDVDLMPPAGASVRIRLHAEAGLSLAARMTPLVAAPAAVAAVAAPPAPAAPAAEPIAPPQPPPHPLVAAAPAARRADAEALAPLTGVDLWQAFEQRQRLAWNQELGLLERAAKEPALLAQVADRHRDQLAFSEAVERWAP